MTQEIKQRVNIREIEFILELENDLLKNLLTRMSAGDLPRIEMENLIKKHIKTNEILQNKTRNLKTNTKK